MGWEGVAPEVEIKAGWEGEGPSVEGLAANKFLLGSELPIKTPVGQILEALRLPREKMAELLSKDWVKLGKYLYPVPEVGKETMGKIGKFMAGMIPYETSPREAVIGSLAGPGKAARISFPQEEIRGIAEKGISKGIRPSVVGKATAPQVKQYFDRATQGVKTIIGNKSSLVFSDVEGRPVIGRLPENLREFSQAIDQTKRKVFDQYDSMQKTAGQKGAIVDLAPIVQELNKIAQDKVVVDTVPKAAKYAGRQAKVYQARGSYSSQEAQDAIKLFNNKLDAFYKNPSFDNASEAEINAMIANKMRKALDDVIEKLQGAGYQELKNTYGALKSIEKDVNHRAIVDARKNVKGLLDFTDIFTGGEVISGILTMNPGRVSLGVAARAIKSLYSHWNNPNTIIKNMFGQAERKLSRPTGTTPRSPMGEAVQPFKAPAYIGLQGMIDRASNQ